MITQRRGENVNLKWYNFEKYCAIILDIRGIIIVGLGRLKPLIQADALYLE